MRLALLIAIPAVAGCNHAGQPPQSYAEQLSELNAACRARGGALIPLSNSVSADPANDFICTVPAAAAT